MAPEDAVPSLSELWTEFRVLRHDFANVVTTVQAQGDLLREMVDTVKDNQASYNELKHGLFGTPGRTGDTGVLGNLQDVAHENSRKLDGLATAVRADLDKVKSDWRTSLTSFQWKLLSGLGMITLLLLTTIATLITRAH